MTRSHRLNPNRFLVPCYDNDLIWHSHQLHPIEYATDTSKFLGEVFNHDDSVNDRAPNSKLNRSDDATRQLWRETFKEEFPAPGAMFRGEPLKAGDLYEVSSEQAMLMSSKTTDVTITGINMSGNVQDLDANSQLKISLVSTIQRPNRSPQQARTTVLKLKGPSQKWQDAVRGVAKFKFDTQKYTGIVFELVSKRGWSCFERRVRLGEHVFPLQDIVDGLHDEGRFLKQTIELERNDASSDRSNNSPARYKPANGQASIEAAPPTTINFTASVDRPTKGPCILSLVPSEFGSFTMPESIKQIWGPVPMQRLPEGVDNKCIVASHK